MIERVLEKIRCFRLDRKKGANKFLLAEEKLIGSFVKSVVKKMCRCGTNSLMMNNLGKELTYHNEPQKFYPEIFFITRVR
jgi:hypothetical protein